MEQAKSAEKLGLGGKIGYGIGEVGLNLLVGGISNYLFFFYTDVFGLMASAVGILMVVTRILDAINDPVMGFISDRTKSRWGKFRPYLLYGSMPVAILTVLTFTTPNIPLGWKILWAYVTFNLWEMAFTFIAVPYNALSANLSTDSQERSSISSIKTIFASLGSMIVAVLAKPMTEALGKGNLQKGYFLTFLIFAAISVVIFTLCFLFTREKAELESKEKEKTGIKNQLGVFKGNRPLLALLLYFLFFQVAFSMFRTVEMYYFKYVLLRDELYSIAVLVGSLCAVIGMIAMPAIVKKLDKKPASLICGVIGCFFFLLMYIIPNNLTTAFIGIAFSYLFLAVPYALFFGILPDTVEYGQWKSGIRASGLIISTLTTTQKAGMAIAAAAVGWVMDFAGYVANQVQTARTIHALLALRTIIPMSLVIIGMLCFTFYNLDRKKHGEIVKELQARS